MSGPLITAATVAFAGPQVALGIAAVLVVAGTALFVLKLPPADRVEHEPGGVGLLGAFADPAIRAIALTTLPAGFCIGTVEVAIPAFTEARGEAELAGLLLALWSLSSLVGGLLYGIRRPRGLVESYLAMAVLLPLGCLPLLAASSPAAMAALIGFAGLPIAPMIASRNELVAAVAAQRTQTEAFSWLVTSLVAGLAAGNAVAGAVVDGEGWSFAVAIGVAGALIGALLGFASRGTMLAASPRSA